MPDDTDNVSDNTAETSYRTNWFPDSLADNAQKRPLAPPGLPLVIALADGRKSHHGQIDAAHVPCCATIGPAAPARTVPALVASE